jgi:hypothetical protein
MVVVNYSPVLLDDVLVSVEDVLCFVDLEVSFRRFNAF